MIEFISRNRRFVASVVVVLCLVSLMSWTSKERERITVLERQALDTVAPLFEGIYGATMAVRSWAIGLAELGQLRAENERLKREVDRLTALQTELVEVMQENARLKSMLEFKEDLTYSTITAKVIARNPDNWFDTVLIDKGSSDGIDKDMPVVTARGLVGRVTQVSSHSATVMLLTDADSGVGSLVQRSRDAGVVLGAHGATTEITMKMFSRDANVIKGDTIVTSGLGGIFPQGLLIGEVLSTYKGDFGLVKYAVVKPAAELSRLSEVLVVLPQPR